TGDDDGDGLTNLSDCLLGTLPGNADTDNDGALDGQEVAGVALADRSGDLVTWYSDPLNADSNNDGIPDGKEWNLDSNGDGLPDDTDGDGVPDLWDDDNDGDGVRDNLDLSPYASTKTVATFSDNSPFQLTMNDLAEFKLVKVEFQFRPTNPDHLWYTQNVLDWPDNDRQGQIQDADGATFYDVDNTLAMSPNDNGDVRL
ncbi:MAG: hypothetical protein KDH89_22360, partial [Anaerolineae bacterium]|nr:hypothetical protein [Anaerolineae bacterium]